MPIWVHISFGTHVQLPNSFNWNRVKRMRDGLPQTRERSCAVLASEPLGLRPEILNEVQFAMKLRVEKHFVASCRHYLLPKGLSALENRVAASMCILYSNQSSRYPYLHSILKLSFQRFLSFKTVLRPFASPDSFARSSKGVKKVSRLGFEFLLILFMRADWLSKNFSQSECEKRSILNDFRGNRWMAVRQKSVAFRGSAP